MSILIFIISLALLILVHEFGHFIVAKKSGIRVDEFGLGFPPKLFSKKWGETTYTLNAIPFGGFVKIFGEDAHKEGITEVNKTRSFIYKPKWIQAAVLVAGVAMNLIFAWLLISLGFMIGLPSSVDATAREVTNPRVIVTEVLPDSGAERSGLAPGDEIISISAGDMELEKESLTADAVRLLIMESKTKDIDITYVRGKSPAVTVQVEPDMETVVGKRAIGVGLDTIGILKLPIHLAVFEGAKMTWLLTKATTVGLAGFFWDAVTLKADFSQVTGPVGIAGVVGQASSLGFVYLLMLVALISVNLAVINLVPFPALDGGRLLFVAIEAIIRKPIPVRVTQWANGVGFVLLLLLMVLVTSHDILKLI